MKKNLIPLAPIETKKSKEEKEAERQKKLDEKATYLGPLADKVVNAIESVFNKVTPPPTGNDMLDVVSLAAVFVFARQIGMNCKGRKTMKSVMKSTIWALTNRIDAFGNPLINSDEAWDDIVQEEGGSDGSNKG